MYRESRGYEGEQRVCEGEQRFFFATTCYYSETCSCDHLYSETTSIQVNTGFTVPNFRYGDNTSIIHEVFRFVCESTGQLQAWPTMRMLLRLLEVNDGGYPTPIAYTKQLSQSIQHKVMRGTGGVIEIQTAITKDCQ